MKMTIATISLALAAVSSPAHASFWHGNDLLSQCDDPELTGPCHGYIAGIVDGANIISSPNDIDPQCMMHVTISQVTDITILYLRSHPATRHHAASALVLLAVHHALGCTWNFSKSVKAR
jgi:hypothetical protein